MEFTFTRLYSKFYINQIINSTPYIEYNNLNYYFQQENQISEDAEETMQTPNQALEEPTTAKESIILQDITCAPAQNKINTNNLNSNANSAIQNNINNDNQEEELIKNYESKDYKNPIKATNIAESLPIAELGSQLNCNNINNNINKIPSENLEKNIIFEVVENKNNNINDNNTKETKANTDNEQELPNTCDNNPNLGLNEENAEEKKTLEFLKFKRDFHYIEPNLENTSKYKRLLAYKDSIYSKVEIQGFVIDKRTYYGNERGNTGRHRLILDDSTGVVSVLVWKNNNENIFNKVRDFVVYNYLSN